MKKIIFKICIIDFWFYAVQIVAKFELGKLQLYRQIIFCQIR